MFKLEPLKLEDEDADSLKLKTQETSVLPGVNYSSSAFAFRVPVPPKELVRMAMEKNGYFPKAEAGEVKRKVDKDEMMFGIKPQVSHKEKEQFNKVFLKRSKTIYWEYEQKYWKKNNPKSQKMARRISRINPNDPGKLSSLEEEEIDDVISVYTAPL